MELIKAIIDALEQLAASTPFRTDEARAQAFDAIGVARGELLKTEALIAAADRYAGQRLADDAGHLAAVAPIRKATKPRAPRARRATP